MINMIATTGFEPAVKGAFAFRESTELDPYADLFASLFTVPVTSPPELVKMPPVSGAESGEMDGLVQELPDIRLALELGPPVIKGLEAAVQLEVSEPVPVFKSATAAGLVVKDLTLEPQPSFPIPIAKPAAIMEPPIKDPVKEVKPPEIGPTDRLPIDFGDVCGLPADNQDTKLPPLIGPPLDVILPPIGERSPVDNLKTDNYDHPVEFEVLEIPSVPLPVTLKEKKEDSVLEIASDVTPPIEKKISVAVAVTEKVPMEPTWNAPKFELPSTFPAPKPKENMAVLMLETFTSNVFVEAQILEPGTGRAMTKGSVDIDGVFSEIVKAPDETPKAELPTEFSFGAGLNGDAGIAKLEKPVLSEVKLKRMIFDQVGSTLTDMALAQTVGTDKRVMKIRLKPAELGTVEITLSRNADGRIEAHFQTDNPQTQHVLKDTLDQLRASLERSGMQVGKLETSCSSFSFAGNDGRGGPQREFAPTGDQPAIESGFEPSTKNQEEKLSRLLNLRA